MIIPQAVEELVRVENVNTCRHPSPLCALLSNQLNCIVSFIRMPSLQKRTCESPQGPRLQDKAQRRDAEKHMVTTADV